ncbi:MAG: hypothetical protein ACJA2W_002574 [Planctomycetota bacterium]
MSEQESDQMSQQPAPQTKARNAASVGTLLLGLLATAACTSNSDDLYHAHVFAKEQRERAGLEDTRRVVVKDPITKQALEVHELGRLEDGAEVPNGKDWRYWPEGNLRSMRTFVNGEPAGLWWSWWRTGALRSAYVHEPGVLTRMAWWHANGFLAAEGLAMHGSREGEWSSWHENSALESVGEMSGGRREGLWTFYDEEGEWTERGMFLGGKRTGDWEFRGRLRAGGPSFGR